MIIFINNITGFAAILQLNENQTRLFSFFNCLKPYKITLDDITKEYKDYYQDCIDNDYF